MPTETFLNQDEIIVEKNIDIKEYSQFLFVRKSNANMEQYEKYILGTLKNIGSFDNYYTQNELEQIIIQKFNRQSYKYF